MSTNYIPLHTRPSAFTARACHVKAKSFDGAMVYIPRSHQSSDPGFLSVLPAPSLDLRANDDPLKEGGHSYTQPCIEYVWTSQ
ncbi:hypothetical protein [Halobacillus campisalis]|uniref:hypothetical protein n=1 Tax=Halobacillus campisalis TaxID=435909 RepID=UPI0036F421EC